MTFTARPLALFLLLAALGAGSTGLLLFRQSGPQFEAAAIVRVARDATDLVELGSLAPQGTDTAIFLQNQSEIITSDTVLQKVVAQLKLNEEWGKRHHDDQKLQSGETSMLKRRLRVSVQPNDSQLQLRATSDQEAEAIALVNATATAYCEYRHERRQRIAQEKIAALRSAYEANAAQVRQAAELVAKASQSLAPEVRNQNPPPPAQAEDEIVKNLRRELNRVTMIYMAQSNKLSLSRNLPADELQKLETQVALTWAGLTNAETAVQSAVRKQEALRAYWLARQELEKAEAVLAPIKQTIETNQPERLALEAPPAILTEPATTAVGRTPPRRIAAQACLLGAVVLLAIGTVISIQPRKPAVAAA